MPTKLIRKQFLLSDDENQKLESEASKRGLSVSNLTRVLYGLEPLKAGGGRKPKQTVKKMVVERK
jgi:hypothetical protein